MMTKFETYATTTTIIIEIKKKEIVQSFTTTKCLIGKIFAVEIIPEWIVFFQLSM